MCITISCSIRRCPQRRRQQQQQQKIKLAWHLPNAITISNSRDTTIARVILKLATVPYLYLTVLPPPQLGDLRASTNKRHMDSSPAHALFQYTWKFRCACGPTGPHNSGSGLNQDMKIKRRHLGHNPGQGENSTERFSHGFDVKYSSCWACLTGAVTVNVLFNGHSSAVGWSSAAG